MHEQAVGFINGCSRTGEAGSYGRTDASHALNCTHCQGIMAPGQKRLKIFTNLRKHAKCFAL